MKILLINGPNLNNLGKRDATFYGSATLPDIVASLIGVANSLNVETVSYTHLTLPTKA